MSWLPLAISALLLTAYVLYRRDDVMDTFLGPKLKKATQNVGRRMKRLVGTGRSVFYRIMTRLFRHNRESRSIFDDLNFVGWIIIDFTVFVLLPLFLIYTMIKNGVGFDLDTGTRAAIIFVLWVVYCWKNSKVKVPYDPPHRAILTYHGRSIDRTMGSLEGRLPPFLKADLLFDVSARNKVLLPEYTLVMAFHAQGDEKAFIRLTFRWRPSWYPDEDNLFRYHMVRGISDKNGRGAGDQQTNDRLSAILYEETRQYMQSIRYGPPDYRGVATQDDRNVGDILTEISSPEFLYRWSVEWLNRPYAELDDDERDEFRGLLGREFAADKLDIPIKNIGIKMSHLLLDIPFLPEGESAKMIEAKTGQIFAGEARETEIGSLVIESKRVSEMTDKERQAYRELRMQEDARSGRGGMIHPEAVISGLASLGRAFAGRSIEEAHDG